KLNKTEACDIAIQHWGLSIASVSQLNSYADLNFLLTTTGRQEYTLKVVTNTAGRIEEIKEIAKVLGVLNKHGIKVPKPILTKGGDIYVKSDQHNTIFTLQSFIPGEVLEDIPLKQPELNDV
uniref:Aminoglycoside phosphotransferase domain-containing protein n=1 Tax=Ciona savignyi TaxID=51511 RepID=H2Y5D1_CIOSA